MELRTQDRGLRLPGQAQALVWILVTLYSVGTPVQGDTKKEMALFISNICEESFIVNNLINGVHLINFRLFQYNFILGFFDPVLYKNT